MEICDECGEVLDECGCERCPTCDLTTEACECEEAEMFNVTINGRPTGGLFETKEKAYESIGRHAERGHDVRGAKVVELDADRDPDEES